MARHEPNHNLEQPPIIAAKDNDSSVSINLIYHGTPYNFSFPLDASISNLSNEIAQKLYVPPSNQKFLISKVGLVKPPFKNPDLPLSSISAHKISLMGSTIDEVSSISIASEEAERRVYRRDRPQQKVSAYKIRDWKKEQEENQYTFIELQPLSYLPNSSRSLHFLQRLKDDAGIRAVMRKHKFTVPLLTEMDPTEHTQMSHEGTSRTLGLNRNQGQIIELRLRTDTDDGYRDYKTIRKTLCHELTHNVYGPHNRDFWDLCKQIEKEVDAADWRSGGKIVGGKEMYQPADDEVDDNGGWTGGEYVLGLNSAKKTVSSPSNRVASRRELLAKAAEERMKRTDKRTDKRTCNGDSGSAQNQ